MVGVCLPACYAGYFVTIAGGLSEHPKPGVNQSRFITVPRLCEARPDLLRAQPRTFDRRVPARLAGSGLAREISVLLRVKLRLNWWVSYKSSHVSKMVSTEKVHF